MRESVYFKPSVLQTQHIVTCAPKHLYYQKKDWTCCFASIATLLSSVAEEDLSEEFFTSTLTPGPYFSKDIKALQVLDAYDVIYGCDYDGYHFDNILQLAQDGYYIMLESLYNYSHWYVLLGYYPLEDKNIEKATILVYDPYYDQTKLLNVDEFIGMWVDASYYKNNVKNDFIAIKAKK